MICLIYFHSTFTASVFSLFCPRALGGMNLRPLKEDDLTIIGLKLSSGHAAPELSGQNTKQITDIISVTVESCRNLYSGKLGGRKEKKRKGRPGTAQCGHLNKTIAVLDPQSWGKLSITVIGNLTGVKGNSLHFQLDWMKRTFSSLSLFLLHSWVSALIGQTGQAVK